MKWSQQGFSITSTLMGLSVSAMVLSLTMEIGMTQASHQKDMIEMAVMLEEVAVLSKRMRKIQGTQCQQTFGNQTIAAGPITLFNEQGQVAARAGLSGPGGQYTFEKVEITGINGFQDPNPHPDMDMGAAADLSSNRYLARVNFLIEVKQTSGNSPRQFQWSQILVLGGFPLQVIECQNSNTLDVAGTTPCFAGEFEDLSGDGRCSIEDIRMAFEEISQSQTQHTQTTQSLGDLLSSLDEADR